MKYQNLVEKCIKQNYFCMTSLTNSLDCGERILHGTMNEKLIPTTEYPIKAAMSCPQTFPKFEALVSVPLGVDPCSEGI